LWRDAVSGTGTLSRDKNRKDHHFGRAFGKDKKANPNRKKTAQRLQMKKKRHDSVDATPNLIHSISFRFLVFLFLWPCLDARA